MKKGKTLQELAIEIERQQTSKQDFVAPAAKIAVAVGADNAPFLRLGEGAVGQAFGINANAHGQLAEYAGIPKAYYDQMKEKAPGLLASNVNHWLQTFNGDKRLVRVLDGNVRGVLSDRYRPLDNFDLANAVLPVLADKKLVIASCEITERRLYIKAFNSAVSSEIQRAGRDVFVKDQCSPVICSRPQE